MKLRRREFLLGAGGVIGAATVGATVGAEALMAEACRNKTQPPPEFSRFKIFNAGEAWALDAFLFCLIPDDEPRGMAGERAAGIIDYFDRELQRPDLHDMQNAIRYGVHALNHAAKREGSTNFAALPDAKQIRLIDDFQHDTLHMGKEPTSPIFKHALAMALEGYLCLPKYGGNKDCAGWRALGLEDRCT